MATTETTGARTGEQFLAGPQGRGARDLARGRAGHRPVEPSEARGRRAEPRAPLRPPARGSGHVPHGLARHGPAGERHAHPADEPRGPRAPPRPRASGSPTSTVGMMGRTPDYLNYTFACFAARADVWARYGNEEGAANLVAYQKRMRDNDLSLTHTLINPQVDRSVPEAEQAGGEVSLHKVEDTENGILVRGARMLATLAPFADELAVYPGSDLRLQDAKYAICFAIPMTTPGLKLRLPRLVLGAARPVGLPALLALRRDGRGRHLRRRRDPARPDLPRRRRPAPHRGHHRHALARAHHPPGDDARLGEARVRVRARPHDVAS